MVTLADGEFGEGYLLSWVEKWSENLQDASQSMNMLLDKKIPGSPYRCFNTPSYARQYITQL